MSQDPTPRYTAAAQWSPSTFEERGTTIAFTTPLLACSRIRNDERHGLVLLTPHFSETRSIYVMPWSSLGTIVSMSLHDRALHEAIETGKAVDPDGMRNEVMAVAATGLAGPEVQDAAIKAQIEQRHFADEMQCLLLLSLLRDLRLDVSHLMSLQFDDGSAISKIRAAFHEAVRPLGLDGEEIYAHLAALSVAIAPVGLVTYGRSGRLRRLLSQLVDFRTGMERRCAGQNTEAEASYGFCGEVATHTINIAESILLSLDGGLTGLTSMLRHWDSYFVETKRLCSRLSWLLDGWDYALGFAAGMNDWRREESWINLDTLVRMLPIVPRQEAEEQDSTDIRFAELVQRRRVVAAEDWRTGRIDLELKRRLEAAKAAALAPAPPRPLPAPPTSLPQPQISGPRITESFSETDPQTKAA